MSSALNLHIGWEDNPERLSLNHSMSKSAWSWVNNIVVGWVCDYIDLTPFASSCSVPESNATVRQALPVVPPIWITLPTIISWVTCATWFLSFWDSRGKYSSVKSKKAPKNRTLVICWDKNRANIQENTNTHKHTYIKNTHIHAQVPTT